MGEQKSERPTFKQFLRGGGHENSKNRILTFRRIFVLFAYSSKSKKNKLLTEEIKNMDPNFQIGNILKLFLLHSLFVTAIMIIFLSIIFTLL